MKTQDEKKYSILKAFVKPFWIISDHFKNFLKQGCVFSFIVLVLSYVLGQKYICIFNKNLAQNMYCPDAQNLYLVYLFIKLLVISVFIAIWYDSVFNKCHINKEYFKANKFKFLKVFLVVIAFIIINFIPIVSTFILILRVPNPVWQIEQLFFTIVSIGFVLPIVLMRFYGLFALFLAGENWKRFGQAWKNTSWNNVKILFSNMLLVFIYLLTMLSASRVYIGKDYLPIEMYNMLSEFVFAFAGYFVIILQINFFEFQKQFFLSDK